MKSIEFRNLGTPQGGVILPVLANIYLNEMDKFLESVKESFDNGKRKKVNPEYTKMIRGAKVNHSLKINPLHPKDEKYKRLNFIRYADDFLIGVIGSYSDCWDIREKIKEFLSKVLKLTLNLEKTKITNAKKDSAKFLGYRIYIGTKNKDKIKYVLRGGNKVLTRVSSRPMIDGPINEIVNKLQEKGFAKAGKSGKPMRKSNLVYLPLHEIINRYKILENGICNYYAMANNYRRLSARIHYILKYSCILTIASKLNLKTMKRVIKTYGKNLVIKYGENKTMSYPVRSYKRPKKRSNIIDYKEYIELLIMRIEKYSLRVNNELKGACSVCKSENDVEMHHVKAIRKSKANDHITKMMRNMNKRQIPLCKKCHNEVHKGLYDGKKL